MVSYQIFVALAPSCNGLQTLQSMHTSRKSKFLLELETTKITIVKLPAILTVPRNAYISTSPPTWRGIQKGPRNQVKTMTRVSIRMMSMNQTRKMFLFSTT